MFGFLKDKLKGALSVFSKKVEEEGKEESPEVETKEVKEEIVEEKKEEVKEIKEEVAEKTKEEVVEEKKEEVKKEVKEEVKEELKEEIKDEIKEKVVEEQIKIIPKVEEKKVEPKPEIKVEKIKVEEKKVEKKVEQVEPVVEKKIEVKVEEKKPVEPKPEVKVEEKKEELLQAEEKIEHKEEKKGFFSRLTSKIGGAVTTTSVSDIKFDELFWDLEVILLENNVAVEVIDKIKADLKNELVNKPITRGKVQDTVLNSLKKSISELFDFSQIDFLEKAKSKKPFVVCFVGVNGSGKTTSIAKVANLLIKNKLSVVLAAADTFRAAAIDQLQLHADKLGVKLIRYDYGADAAAVAFDAVKYAEAKNKDVVLIDTAGRLHSNHNLVEEMKKIVRVSKPDMIVFVGESITGNDCVEQAKQFNEAVNLDGIILSKADIDEKGGAAISVSYVTKKPILFIGTGQEYDDLEQFDKTKILSSIGL